MAVRERMTENEGRQSLRPDDMDSSEKILNILNNDQKSFRKKTKLTSLFELTDLIHLIFE